MNNWYIEQLKLKAKGKFGVSSEKVDSDQLSLFDLFNKAETLQELITIEPELETVVKAHSRKKSKRGSKFDNLPVEVIEHKLDESEMICDVYGEPLTVMKKETRRELVIIPAQAKIVEHATYFYSCKNCDKSRYLNIVSCKLLNRSNLVNCFCLGVMCVLELTLTNYSETF